MLEFLRGKASDRNMKRREPGPHVRGCWVLRDDFGQRVTAMTENEWLTTPDPERLSLYLAETASDRKLRLLAAACCRRLMAWNKHSRVLEALCRVERYADGQLADSTMEKWGREMWRAMVRRDAQYIICWARKVWLVFRDEIQGL